jgi:uncharacterized membrane protein
VKLNERCCPFNNIRISAYSDGFNSDFCCNHPSAFLLANNENQIKSGVAIMIGPFPILFGTDVKSVKILLVLSIILMVFVLLSHIALNYL